MYLVREKDLEWLLNECLVDKKAKLQISMLTCGSLDHIENWLYDKIAHNYWIVDEKVRGYCIEMTEGNCIEMTESNFAIKKGNFEAALKSLKDVFVLENMSCYDYVSGKGKKYPHFSWVITENVLESTNLREALSEIRFTAVYDQDGNICNVEFTGEKYGDEEIFFNALAPYVEPGSYLRFKDKDGNTWKWLFENKLCKLRI